MTLLRSELALAIRNQTEMENKINKLNLELRETKEFYEKKITSLQKDLTKQTSLRVLFYLY